MLKVLAVLPSCAVEEITTSNAMKALVLICSHVLNTLPLGHIQVVFPPKQPRNEPNSFSETQHGLHQLWPMPMLFAASLGLSAGQCCCPHFLLFPSLSRHFFFSSPLVRDFFYFSFKYYDTQSPTSVCILWQRH